MTIVLFTLAPPKTTTLTKEAEVDLLRAGWNSYTRPPVFYALILTGAAIRVHSLLKAVNKHSSSPGYRFFMFEKSTDRRGN